MTKPMKPLSKKAMQLLKRIARTEDASLRLTRGIAKPAQELKDHELAEFIRLAFGGADVCLNQAGCDLAEANETPQEGEVDADAELS